MKAKASMAGSKDLADPNQLSIELPDAAADNSAEEQMLDKALRKVSLVVLPLLFLASGTNYIDRTALSFAALQLNADLGLSAQEYGLAAGIFSLGYGLGHIPSAYLGMRVGIRWWFACIVMAWGLTAMATALVHNAAGLCVQRVMLGLAEAGAVPCSMHLLAQFYPRNRLTQPMTICTMGLTLSTMVAAPLAAGLTSITAGNLKGWQWLFIIEGLLPVLLGLLMLFTLPSRPINGNAWMLTPEEQQLVDLKVHGPGSAGNGASRDHLSVHDLLHQMRTAAQRPVLWFFTFAGLLWVLCVHSLHAFMPIIIRNMLAGTAATASTAAGGSSPTQIRNAMLLTTIPYITAAVAMWITGWHSDRVNERTLHIGVTALAGSIFWFCLGAIYRASFVAGFVSLILTLALASAQMGVMYARVSEALEPRHTAIGVAMFNAIGAALGGFLGPYVTGAVVHRMGSFVQATLIQASFLLASGTLVTAFGIWEQVHKRKARQLLLGADASSSGRAEREDCRDKACA